MKTKNTKRVTLSLLEKLDACESGVKYWESLPEKHREDPLWLMQHAIDSDDKDILKYANWLIVQLLSTKNTQRYAVFAARQALPLFEERRHLGDDRPRKAIEAAEAVIRRNTAENREKASIAARAIHADYAAGIAARAAAAAAAAAAAWADSSAAYAAWATVYAADSAAYAAYAARDDRKNMRTKILKYGMELLS